jgi:hypothetical protein
MGKAANGFMVRAAQIEAGCNRRLPRSTLVPCLAIGPRAFIGEFLSVCSRYGGSRLVLGCWTVAVDCCHEERADEFS